MTARNGEQKTYIGSTDRPFKERFYGHTADMKNKEHRNNTTLASYIWDKKDEGVAIKISEMGNIKKVPQVQSRGGHVRRLSLRETGHHEIK